MRTRNSCYWTFLAILAVATVLEVIYYYDDDVAVFFYIASCLAIGGGVYFWCWFDSRARGYVLSQGMRYTIAFVGPVGVPVYFARTRGARSAAKLIFGLWLYAPFYGLFYGTWYATGFVLQQLGFYA